MATPAELVSKHVSQPLDKAQTTGKSAYQIANGAKSVSSPSPSPTKGKVTYKPLGNTVLKPDDVKKLQKKIEPVVEVTKTDLAEFKVDKVVKPTSSIDRPPSSAPLCDGTITITIKEGVKPEYKFTGTLYGRNVRNGISLLFRSYNKWQWSKRKGV